MVQPDDMDNDADEQAAPAEKPLRLPDCAKMRADIENSRGRRTGDVLLWDWARRYLAGDQNITWDRAKKQFTGSLLDSGGKQRNRTVTNQLLGPYRSFLNLMRVRQPKMEWHGGAASWDNLTKAMACNVASSYWWQQNKMPKVLRRMAKYLFTDATAAMHTFFDTRKRQVVTEVLPAYDVLFEANALTYDESRWIAVRHIYTKDDLKACYPKDKKFIDELSPISQLDNRAQVPDDRLDVWDVYFKDGTGRHGILLADRWLWEGVTPGKVCPVSPVKCIDVPGYVYGLSMTAPLIDPQRRYNRYRNMQLDIADMHSAPTWVVATQSNVPKGLFNNSPDNVIPYNIAGGPPQRVQPGQVPQQLFEITNGSQGEIADVSGLYPSVMGKRSVGVTAGVAMEQLSDASAGQLSDLLSEVTDAVAEQARVALVYWKEYLPEAELVEFLDESIGAVVSKELSGTDLLDAPNVFITEGTMFTIDAEQRDKKLLDLMQLGVTDAEQVKKQLSFKLDNMAMTKKMIALSHAKDLLEWCRKGQQIELFPEDDLPTIRDVFLEFMNSDAYYEPMMRSQMAYDMTGNDLAIQEYERQREVCEYVRDVVVSIDTFGQPVDAYLMASNSKVFPRTDPKPQEAIQAVAGGPQSAGAQRQMLGQDVDMRQRAAKMQNASANYEAMKGTPGIPGARG